MIVISITAPTMKEALLDIKQAKNADLIELRLDLIKDITLSGLEKLIKNKRKRIIVTDRRKRLKLIRKAIELKVDYIDLDIMVGEETIREIISEKNNTKVIVSFHDYRKTDKRGINRRYAQIKKLKPDVIKIAAFARDINDNNVIFDLIKKAGIENKKIIALCMGKKGQVSRILSVMYGAEFIFCSLREGKEAAPGQITAETLKNIYRVCDLKEPKIFGLVGNPVKHSKGFIVHNKAFGKMNMRNVYVNFLVEDLAGFIRAYKGMISGLSVTIPFKREVIKYLDKVDPIAEEIGAVNTIVKRAGKLIGYNTDVKGAIDAIKEKINIRNKKVLIIGAGGVVRAIAFGIKKEKGKLVIINRTVKKAEVLAKELNCEYGGLDKINEYTGIDVLINGTSIGMFPDVNKTPVKKTLLRKIVCRESVVFDSVYNPSMTKLLKDAASLGCSVISGEKMFINQAGHQFKLFTGRRM